jgi:phage/plasmid-like protein (TIGR03299 family)
MAHLVETMAYVGQTPWHGLGNPLTPNQPLEVWARQAGMDWTIESSPVRFVAGKSAHVGSIEAFEDHKVLYRSDTHAPLSVVSNRYQVVQPREVLEFYRDLTEVSGFQLETAGVLKGGKKVWALARTGQSGMLKGKDVTRGYVLLATACDGTLATTAQFTSIRVVCNNTLTISLEKDAKGAVRVPHSTKFDANAVKKQLGLCVSGWDAFMHKLKVLSECKVSDDEAQRFMERLFIVPTEQGPKPSEGMVKHSLSLYHGGGRGADLPSAKHTAYGLLNAVTEFVDHQRRARSTDYRLDSAWFGHGATLKQKAFEQAIELTA